MVRLLIAHHLSIVADLEHSERKRNEAFTTIELAIQVFKKVALAWTLSKYAYPTKKRSIFYCVFFYELLTNDDKFAAKFFS